MMESKFLFFCWFIIVNSLLLPLINSQQIVQTPCNAGGNIPYMTPTCQPGYNLVNGWCYLQNQASTNYYCPNGYYYINNSCQQIVTPIPPPPCNAVATPQPQPEPQIPPTPPPPASLPPTPPPPAPSTPPPPPPAELTRCPPGSVFTDKQCRKLICSQGEYHAGRCLQPACPEGSVWRGRRCQKPGYVTTILEIENIFINEAHHKPGIIIKENINNNQTPAPVTSAPTTLPPDTIIATTRRNTPRPTTTTIAPTPKLNPKPTHTTNGTNCCTIITPRICKQYGKKWICFNRKYKHCDDPVICTHPRIYLKISEIVYNPPTLLMPPNPPLEACITQDCDNSNTVDCSGCAHGRRESCSPHCYHYTCPHGACSFINLQDYCVDHPGTFGCTKLDGCLWDWCGEKDCKNGA